MGLREHLTYANVAATLALAGVIGGGGAYAAGVIDSGDIADNAVKSQDLKDRAAVSAKDVKRNGLTGTEVREATLKSADFAPIAGDQGINCDPISPTFVDCAKKSVRLRARGRLLAIATGNFYSEGAAANLTCRIAIDGVNSNAGASPGEATDSTDLTSTDGFAATLVTDRLAKGSHTVALRCSEPTAGDGQLASASIAVLGISG
jgi:hypothetical protein